LHPGQHLPIPESPATSLPAFFAACIFRTPTTARQKSDPNHFLIFIECK
jgi:hypothetical protein